MGLSNLLGKKEAGAMVHEILGTWVGPLFTVIGGVGAIYIVILAIQYIRSEISERPCSLRLYSIWLWGQFPL